MTILITNGCNLNQPENKNEAEDFQYLLEQFADIKIMQYQVPGFEELSLQQKELIYYLSEAANCGRDIIFDQFYKHNLTVRKTNEAIINSYSGDKTTADFKNFLVYAKRVWFSNGIHHHYSTDKFYPEIPEDYLAELILHSDTSLFPLKTGESLDTFIARVSLIIFDKNIDNKRIVLDDAKDIVAESATNFYEGVSQKEVEDFNSKFIQPDKNKALSIGLNSQLLKENGKVVEKVYKIDGLYGKAIEKIVFCLEKAHPLAETDIQKQSIELLIKYYKTGDLKTWDDYNVAWVQDLDSRVDFVNGFIENYGDPLGMKATWESVVNFKDIEATKRAEIISSNAQWFEDNAPINNRFKKKKVKGVSAKVITVAQLGGDCYPTTPIGINLPNADWIRRDHGSKSVSIENITFAYDKAAQGNGFLEEFSYSQDEIELAKKYGSLASNLHTDLHECLGHGSGKLLPGISSDALKNYSSALEEARADLFALYYLGDKKSIELGLFDSFDVCKAEYNSYLRNGLMTQLTRIQPGKDIEQAHMRNRQLIAKWCYEKGQENKIVELIKKDNKTFVVINDYTKLRELFGELLAEIQRIKSEGDFEAGKALVEKYAVKVDTDLHNEVLTRFKKLNIAPYGGFVNPVFSPVYKEGKLINVNVNYNEAFINQMLRYSKEYSYL
ncbi:MAG: dihydrofolate reductase [Salinivirgaceae bacterium]|nr:dihydrofolate reductase [Salinivirgaceae bacterium]